MGFIGIICAAAYGLALVRHVLVNPKGTLYHGRLYCLPARNIGIHPVHYRSLRRRVSYGLVVYQLVIKRVIDNDMFVPFWRRLVSHCLCSSSLTLSTVQRCRQNSHVHHDDVYMIL